MINYDKKESPTAIEKTLEILIALTNNDREMGTCEISELTGFHKATTSRILASLLEYDLVAQNTATKKYNLGPLAYRLGTTRNSQSIQAFVEVSKPYLVKLRDKVNESINLEVWTGNGTVACYMTESRNPLRVAMEPADLLPLHAPAGAKAILSFISETEAVELLDDDFERFTKNTITSKNELLQRLKEYNRQGYATDNEELYLGIYAVGVPIFDYLSKPVAAICAVVPFTRINQARETEIVNEVKKVAKLISKEVKNSSPFS